MPVLKRSSRYPCLLHGLLFAFCVLLAAVPAAAPDGAFAVTDSLYQAHHPRLLFEPDDLLLLQAKVTDGGYDDDAYAYLRYLAESIYPYQSPTSLMAGEYGLASIPNLGIAGWFETPTDTATLEIGRDLTLYIAQNYTVDNDEAGSGLRLRALVLGYDMFFWDAPESLRTTVVDEIVDYMSYMTTRFTYVLFEYRPYLANHSAMFAGPLGMAGICLDGEADPALTAAALDKADSVIDSLLTYQFDPGGAYKEGCLYAGWTLRQLIPYFDARKRFDGYDYASRFKIRNVERWLPYEILPEGLGATNNLNDSPYNARPLARHSTYLSWAQSAWGSGLAAWLWEHTSGPFGVDYGTATDKAATVLWNLGLTPVQPDSVLPTRQLWLDRGLYYYRTGWQSGLSSDDVVFSFQSGKFHGGHWQEDVNQFTLYAYGGKFAIDHGSGSTPRQSESHNMVFIDGLGQHNAGLSIGTDGKIAAYLLSDFADYMVGDATAAYTTYSEFNENDWPFPGVDWSWGHKGANPVLHALRNIVVVHDDSSPPYFVIVEDIDKDGSNHDYDWRLHTLETNTVDVSANPIEIDAPTAALDIHVLQPDFGLLTRTTEPYDNTVLEPNSTLIKLSYNAVNPRFALLLLPSKAATPVPTVNRETQAWGFVCTLEWPAGYTDVVLGNHSGGAVTWGPDSLRTDAAIAVVRHDNTSVTRYLLVDATVFDYDGMEYLRMFDAPASCALAGGVVELDRGDADFRLLDTGIQSVESNGVPVTFVESGGYLFASTVVSVRDRLPRRGFDVTVYPNPFNPTVTIRIELPDRRPVKAEVFDAAGRRVRVLANGDAGPYTVIRWDGANRYGRPVPSGVYFLRVTAGDLVRTSKMVVTR